MNAFDKGFFSEIEKKAGIKGPGGVKSFVQGFRRPEMVNQVGKRLTINKSDTTLNPITAAKSTKYQLVDKMRGVAPKALDATKQWHNTAKWGARARKAVPYAAAAGAMYLGHRMLRADDNDRRN